MTTFEGIIGNVAALRRLQQDLHTGRASHAYLFYGSSGVGKRTVARRFGAALVAAGDAAAEDRARRGLHPDLVEVEPEGVFTTIGQAREVAHLAANRPFEGARRVFILEADTLNAPAANALLKTLEEPEGEAVFLLLAASREGVLPTVASRARPVRFDPVPVPDVAQFLEEREVEAAALAPALAAALGRGSVGLSLRYTEGTELTELRATVFEAAFAFEGDYEDRRDAAAAIMTRAEAVDAAREAEVLGRFEEPETRRAKDVAKRAGRAGRAAAVREALELLTLVYRDAAVVEAGVPELAANTDRVEEIQARVDRYPGADWAEAALGVGEARSDLTYNVSPEAILEVALSRTRQRIYGYYPGS